MSAELLSAFAERGWQARIVPVARVEDLRKEVRARFDRGEFDGTFFRSELERVATGEHIRPEVRSVVLVASPQPVTQVGFTWEGEHHLFPIPPTYLYRQAYRKVKRVVKELSAPADLEMIKVPLPNKLLAARSGLAQYGRNNIIYVPGMGSFCSLLVFACNLPPVDEVWQEPQMLERCATCVACMRHCPTGAIGSDRFLLHGERCITFHNERPSDEPFPEWMHPAWHNALVGCMFCQRVCPENKDVRDHTTDGAEFDEEETRRLLQGVPPDQLDESTAAKLKAIELDSYLDVLPRNLEALLHHASAGKRAG